MPVVIDDSLGRDEWRFERPEDQAIVPYQPVMALWTVALLCWCIDFLCKQPVQRPINMEAIRADQDRLARLTDRLETCEVYFIAPVEWVL